MAAQIRPNRLDLNDRYPMLGFTIRTSGAPVNAEVALATDPSLFTAKDKRTRANFYTSAEVGPLSVQRGEAVYVVPPEVVSRFIGAQKLYFALATAPVPNGTSYGYTVDVLPTEASPYIALSGLSDRSLRRVRMFPTRRGGSRYAAGGTEPSLVWAGDKAQPGIVPASTPVPPAAAPSPAAATAPVADAPIPYDDGFGPMPASPPMPASAVAPVPAPAAEAPAVQSQALDFSGVTISPDQVPLATPPVEVVSMVRSLAIQALLATTQPALAPLILLARAAAETGIVSVGLGPQVSAGLLGGAGLGAGIIFLQGNNIGVYGAFETDAGLIASIGATLQLTIVKGGIDGFRGISYCASISGGEGITAGASALFDANRTFYGVSVQAGVGLGLSPVEIFLGVQRQIATQLGVAQAFGADRYAKAMSEPGESIEVKYRMFIPSPAINGPFENYGGDGRGFSYSGGTSRGEITARVQLTAGGGIDSVDVVDRRWDPSTAYASGDTWHPDGQPDWWLEKNDGASPTNSGQLDATDDNLRIYVGAPGTFRNVLATTEQASIVTIYASGENVLATGAPAIDADVSLLIRRSGGGIEVKAVGEHDGFPAHELYVNGQLIHSYDPVAAGEGPMALFPPCDRDVDTSWTTIPATATAQSLGVRPRTLTRAKARGLSEFNESFTINWDDLELVPQPTNVSCWAAAGAMLVGWRDRVSLTPETLASICGRTTATGLDPAQVQQFADQMGLVSEPPQSYSMQGFRSLVDSVGPLWVAAKVPGLHAIVVTGLYNEGEQLYVRISDPWDRAVGAPGAPGAYADSHATGSRYIMKWEDFVAEYEQAAIDVSTITVQILHAGGTDGRQPNRGENVPLGYAQSARGRARTHAMSAHAMSADDFTLNWDDVQSIAQPTDLSCWATAGAMVIGWRDEMSLPPEAVAEIGGRSVVDGLHPSQVGQFADEVGLIAESPQSYTVDAFRQMVEDYGPLWVGAAVPSLHAIVVTGLYRSGSDVFVRITDPWDRAVGDPGASGAYADSHVTGSRYIMKWEDFVAEYEKAATDYSVVNLQILHGPRVIGRQPNRGESVPAGYAQGLASSYRRRELMGRTLSSDELGPGTSLSRVETDDGAGKRYDLAQLTGFVMPATVPEAIVPPVSGVRIVLDDWPYIEDASGRTQAPVAIDWAYAGGSVGNVTISAAPGQVLDGWSAAVKADIATGASTSTVSRLVVTVITTFTKAGQPDQVAVSEVVLGGDGQSERRHGVTAAPPPVQVEPVQPVPPVTPAAPPQPAASAQPALIPA